MRLNPRTELASARKAGGEQGCIALILPRSTRARLARLPSEAVASHLPTSVVLIYLEPPDLGPYPGHTADPASGCLSCLSWCRLVLGPCLLTHPSDTELSSAHVFFPAFLPTWAHGAT